MQLTLSSLLGPGTPPPSPPAPAGETAGGAAFAYLLAQTLPATPLPSVAAPARQPTAGGGKDLPLPFESEDPAGDSAHDDADLFALTLPVPAAVLPQAPTPLPAQAVSSPDVPSSIEASPYKSPSSDVPVGAASASAPAVPHPGSPLPERAASMRPMDAPSSKRTAPVPPDALPRERIATVPVMDAPLAERSAPMPVVDARLPEPPAPLPSADAPLPKQDPSVLPIDAGPLRPASVSFPDVPAPGREEAAAPVAATVTITAAPDAQLPTEALPDASYRLPRSPTRIAVGEPTILQDHLPATPVAPVESGAKDLVVADQPGRAAPVGQFSHPPLISPVATDPASARATASDPSAPTAPRDSPPPQPSVPLIGATAAAVDQPMTTSAVAAPQRPSRINVTVVEDEPALKETPVPVGPAMTASRPAPPVIETRVREPAASAPQADIAVAVAPAPVATPIRAERSEPAAAAETPTVAATSERPPSEPVRAVPAKEVLAPIAANQPARPSVDPSLPAAVLAEVPARFREAAPAARDERGDADPVSAPSTADTAERPLPSHVGQPAAETTRPDTQPKEQGATLHREAAWAERMMGRIEEAREVSDATDRRIRITPDALGTVDLHVRRDGDAVQVQLTAEHAATRAMLAEAAPRLNDWAGGRSLQFAGGQADGGSGQRPNPQPQPDRPAPRAASAATDTLTTTDHRIA